MVFRPQFWTNKPYLTDVNEIYKSVYAITQVNLL